MGECTNQIPVEPQGIPRANFGLRAVQIIAIINGFFGENGRLLIKSSEKVEGAQSGHGNSYSHIITRGVIVYSLKGSTMYKKHGYLNQALTERFFLLLMGRSVGFWPQ